MNSIVKYLPDTFVLGLFGMILLAYAFPGGANPELGLDQISQVGVWLIFFFYGLKIPKASLQANVVHWRLHLSIQLTTFLVIPVLTWCLKPLLFDENQSTWWLGFWFLAVLPSTVSSSVVMVGIAKGNVPGALFNATLSGLIGVLVTPLWISGQVPGQGILSLYSGLFLEVVLPAVLGLVLQPWGGKWVQQHAKSLAWMDKVTIWLIVYLSFAETFLSSAWREVAWTDLRFVALTTLGLFVLFFGLIQGVNRLTQWFTASDEVAWLLCGSKKSLVHGSVFLPILFPDQASGLILLPLMFYHAWQLIIVGYWAASRGR